jgi:hypothetical protein
MGHGQLRDLVAKGAPTRLLDGMADFFDSVVVQLL